MIAGLEHILNSACENSTNVDCVKAVEEYVDRSDWRIFANANTGYSNAGLVNGLAGKVIANYWLDRVYNKEEGATHRDGSYHIHDLDGLNGYCCGHDLQRLLNEGFNGVEGRVGSRAPKHIREALYQMANFIGILQAEWSGAQAFSSFDTYLAPYVFFDMAYGKQVEVDIKKALRNFIYNLNVPSRWGQSPFSNVTIDWTVPNDMREQYPMRNEEHYFVSICNDIDFDSEQGQTFLTEVAERLGEETMASIEAHMPMTIKAGSEIEQRAYRIEQMLPRLNYKHFQKEMNIINRAFYTCLNEGDINGMSFTFPIPTINITEDFDWDGENTDILFENTAKYGSSYFQNFIGSQFKRNEQGELERDPSAYSPNDVRSMCCRLQLDKRELRKRGGGLFGSDAQTGSIGVVTINMARLGYQYACDKEALIARLDELLLLAKSTLEKKRVFIQELFMRGLYPYTKRYLRGFKTFFSTIGVNGMNEMVRNFTKGETDITSKWGQEFSLDLLNHIRSRMQDFQEETGNLYNLEATPAEGTTYRFAREDKKHCPGILQAGTADEPYYTNSSQIPVGYTDDAFEALDLQDDLQTRYTGGTVLHLYMSERLSDANACKRLIRKVLSNYRLPYISITPTYSICPIHGYIAGAQPYCPICDAEILAKHSNELQGTLQNLH